MAKVQTANFGRHETAKVFGNTARRVLLVPPGLRAVTGCQEIDEADAPEEHRILKALLGALYHRVGWGTHVPLLIPRGAWRVVNKQVIPASRGVPKQSPARQVVWARLRHRARRNLPPLNVFNTHFPRKANVLTEERKQCWETLAAQVAEAWARGESSLITADANGMKLSEIHPRAQSIGGKGIDWIVAVEHPHGVQFEVTERWTTDMHIDAHNAHGVRLKLRRPNRKRKA